MFFSDFTTFIQHIKRQNTHFALPGQASHTKLFPSNRIDLMKQSKDRDLAVKSAVLLLFYEDGGVIKLPLIKRTEDGFTHSGQVSFPGGKVEKEDVDICKTALRETQEEIGIELSEITVIGQLSDLFIPVSNFVVTPVLAYMKTKPQFVPNADEVQYVISCDLKKLIKPTTLKSKMMNFKGQDINIPYFDVDGEVVWGATAMILSELIDFLKG